MYQITKKIDSLGRISIPVEVRRALYWTDGDEIQITVEPGQILKLQKVGGTLPAKIKGLKDAVAEYCEINSIDTNEIFDAFNVIEKKLTL